MKFGQLKEQDIFSFKNHAESEENVQDLFLLFERLLYQVKSSGLYLNFDRF